MTQQHTKPNVVATTVQIDGNCLYCDQTIARSMDTFHKECQKTYNRKVEDALEHTMPENIATIIVYRKGHPTRVPICKQCRSILKKVKEAGDTICYRCKDKNEKLEIAEEEKKKYMEHKERYG